ncbi:MAG TPA: ADP-ribosylglycohydrolase family protein [Paenibacillus sp.]|uniref:ADP-ribosylglycohydrolase family protein n=1 Tax=Paenibacillus sp. TaxID=58172 RepID=UPI0028D1378D|nr:ADP-ribosylglycohydrolase family protein [Paenibacillus sp.]HUC91907.1 ADP-ribosylglycohydrolase family protein [Paenibacillus sp.]
MTTTEKEATAAVTIPADYIERVYAGWLGKVIGVRHGGNVEGWTYERLQRTFGEITDYLHQFNNFAADDDTNGPMFFLRALEDYTHTLDITPEQMGLAWLNYAPDGHGFFWWGGYGKSTEHTAYLNLKNGIAAPRSGSIEQNGPAVAEQIGGQIFIDAWGLIAPNQPELAAKYADKIASVSHDGNGKYGGMFIAACIAAAFGESSIEAIIEAGLSVIPPDCEYACVTRDLVRFHREHPDHWRECFQYVHDHYGYDKYPGNCHIIPNSAVIILSLLYGKGEFTSSINICNMCGWDTDCNVANVGTILGVKNGLSGIDMSWRKPINDFLCCSSVIGTLNSLDLPWCASYIARLGYKIAGVRPPAEWAPILEQAGPRYHFEYPGSTHAFRVDSDAAGITGFVENTEEAAHSGERSLKVVFDYANGGFGYRAYVKTYYEPQDFNDSRYDPSFSPLLYPGQTIECHVLVPDGKITDLAAKLYIKDRNSGRRIYGEEKKVSADQWEQLSFRIPFMYGVCISEAGVEFVPVQEERRHLALPSLIAYIDDFHFFGGPDYAIDFAGERLEPWNGLHVEVSQLTFLRGIWTLEDGELSGSYSGEPAEAYTGDLQWRNYAFEAEMIPKLGDHHHINFRVQGGIRSYAAGLTKDGRLALYKNDNGYTELASCAFDWEPDQACTLRVEARDNVFEILAGGRKLITYEDTDRPYLYGQVGFSNWGGSHTHYTRFAVKELA